MKCGKDFHFSMSLYVEKKRRGMKKKEKNRV